MTADNNPAYSLTVTELFSPDTPLTELPALGPAMLAGMLRRVRLPDHPFPPLSAAFQSSI